MRVADANGRAVRIVNVNINIEPILVMKSVKEAEHRSDASPNNPNEEVGDLGLDQLLFKREGRLI